MSEGERVATWLILLAMVGLGGLIYNDQTKNERMAKAGFVPMRLIGSTEVYWVKHDEQLLGPKGF